MAKQQISLRIKDELFDSIKTIMEKKNLSMTDAIELIVSAFSEYQTALKFFFQLFQQNAPNLEITDEQKFKAMKILELMKKNE